MSTLHGQIMNDSLPQLPAPDVVALSDYFDAAGQRHSLAFTADQLHAYALAAIAQADAQIEALTAQRDELLARMQELVRAHAALQARCWPGGPADYEQQRDRLRNAWTAAEVAIAKCKEAA